MFHYPTFNPIALSLGPIHIYWYGICYVVGIFLCLQQCRLLAPRFRLQRKIIDDCIPYIVGGIIIGGRLGFVLFYDLASFLDNPTEIIMVWQGGMSFHGGLLGVCVGLWLYCRKHHLALLNLGDVIAISSPLAIGFGRIGNFINKEHLGVITNSWIGMACPDGTIRHASQLYEALGEGFLLWLLFYKVYRRYGNTQEKGYYVFLFLFLYGVIRCVLEVFRTPDGMMWGISYGQWLCLPMIIVGLLGVLFKKQ